MKARNLVNTGGLPVVGKIGNLAHNTTMEKSGLICSWAGLTIPGKIQIVVTHEETT